MNSKSHSFILGCGNFGGIGSLPELLGLGESKMEAFELLDLAQKLGINKFDTANSYGGGLSETYLGEWINQQGSDYRSKIQIHSKVGNPYGTSPGNNPLSEPEILNQLQGSLGRLKTNHLDVYYIHQPDPLTRIEETIRALIKCIQNKKVRQFGLSNVNLSYLKTFISILGNEYFSYLFGVQNEFNFLNQCDSDELIPYIKSKNLHYAAFSPLAGGLLSGKYDLEKPFPKGSRLSLRADPYRSLLNTQAFEKIAELEIIARSHKRHLPEQAIRFVLQETDFVIIGPRKKEHYENLGFKFDRA